jgi:hypothetical protein
VRVRLDLSPEAEGWGRAASAALPPKEQVRSARTGGKLGADHRPTDNRLACDVCGRARTRDERHRLVWQSDPAARLVLAELCRDCATIADPLLELYGGRGCDAIRLVQEIRASPPPRRVQPRVLGYTTRGILYLVIAIGSFLLVTLVTSGGR